MSSRSVPPRCVEEEYAQFVLLRELMQFMTPLFVVSTNTACPTNQFFVAVPPDGVVEDFVVPGTSDEGKRLFQAVVRSHIFSGPSEDQLASLGGHSASLSRGVSTDEPGAEAGAIITVVSSSGVAHSAVIEKCVTLPSNPSFTFLFVNRSLHHVLPMSRRTLASMRSFGVSGSQPLWQRVPCSAMRPIRAQIKLLQRTDHPNTSGSDIITSEMLLPYFKSDEQSFRQFVVDFAIEKGDEIVLRRLSVGPTKRPESQPDEIVTSTVVVQGALQTSLDKAMMFIDTEVGIFRSSYMLVKGYEDFIVAKVLQMVDTACELVADEVDDDNNGIDADDCDVAVKRCSLENKVDDVESGWSEEDQEQLGVAFHSLVTGGLGAKLIPHWEDIYYNEDFAFCHACGVLRRRAGSLELLGAPFPHVAPGHCDQVIQLLRLLDDRSLSVFSYMRIMESSITAAVDLVTHTAVAAGGSNVEVTADICIPLIVYLLVLTGPKCLPSRVKYILEFCTPVLEMSALGYALTTFEAAAVQLLEEYRVRVTLHD